MLAIQGASKLLIVYLVFFFISWAPISFAVDVPIYDFSIKSYSQNVDDFLPPDSPDYATPLLSAEYQALQLQRFYNHYYASDPNGLSPWSQKMVEAILPVVKKIEPELLEQFNNQNAPPSEKHYAENFKEQDDVWFLKLKKNMNLSAIASSIYQKENRAIAVHNTFARALPETAPDFFHFTLAGQGFPFDNLQDSAIWVGTPLYIFSLSQNKEWALVLTPDAYFSWVKMDDIAYVSENFMTKWQNASKKNLVAITKSDVSILGKNQDFQFKAYIGAVFPLAKRKGKTTGLFIPVKESNQQAFMAIGFVNKEEASTMPLAASKENISKILQQLQNRPYGWGGLFFFNDCSQETKSIFTPFGIWLPRNSSKQAQSGSVLDLSEYNQDKRLAILKEKGHPLMTLIYIPGHIMLYLGNKKIGTSEIEAMTYQNIWGLASQNKDKRYIIGQSLFFPLLKTYPEYPDVHSLVDRSFFKLIYLDALDTQQMQPQEFVKYFIEKVN
jgi:cell wall-associated NlpC family hydrolase